ncbi:MAG TPA: hypothetical protein VGQ24_13320 [Gemmatimonadales bacterium]|nr:hypothetical protein [Gemmatimonadales bacterium]
MPTTKTPQPGDPFRLDGFLYQLGPADGLVFGSAKMKAVAAFVAANPPLAEPDTNRVRFDASNPDRWTVVRGFRRVPDPDPELGARRKANVNYKLSGQCCEEDLLWVEPVDYLDHVKTQGAALVLGTPNARAKKWRQAWVDAHVAEVSARLDKFSGAWILGGRALLKPREESMDELERSELPGAVAAILTSTFDFVEG